MDQEKKLDVPHKQLRHYEYGIPYPDPLKKLIKANRKEKEKTDPNKRDT